MTAATNHHDSKTLVTYAYTDTNGDTMTDRVEFTNDELARAWVDQMRAAYGNAFTASSPATASAINHVSRRTPMRTLALALFVVTLAAPVSAQTVLMTATLDDFNAIAAYPVEDDGDPRTPEAWLLEIGVTTFTPGPNPFTTGTRFKLVVPTANGLCVEDMFIVETSFSTLTREMMAGRTVLVHKKIAFFGQTTMEVIRLDRKRCR